ncbi:MAG: Gfo/Idh/MocA family oxidoreductase [Neomegalonema sp.]|nr:Gfo/Idh/MocA family oxidoreductase [Neomegalonema sp.]
MTQKPVRLAIIGLGMASKPHLAALKQLAPDIEVGGVFARSPERRSEIAQIFGWPAFESLEAICESDVDGAVVITPPNARREIVAALAAAGKAVLMEKPVERDLARAIELVEICEAANTPLGMVLQHRFRVGAETLTKHIANGAAGEIHMARVSLPWWRDQSYYDAPGRGTFAVDGGGVLLTQAIHVLDLMLSLVGPAARVAALCGTTRLHQMEAEDFATAGLVFANGAHGAVTATTASFPGFAESLELDCEHGSFRLKAGELSIDWRDGRSETVGEVTGTGGGSDPMDFPCDWHRDLIADFADALRNNRPPRVTGRAALEVHRLIDAIERSNREGRCIQLEGAS